MSRNGKPPPSNRRPLKITTVGDGTVGKTCLLISYVKHEFPEDYIPTVFDNYPMDMEVDGLEFTLTLWDTAGQEEYERLRPLSYPNTDAFLLCFAVDSKNSYENVALKWAPELRHHCPRTPIVLVATKTDLRNNANIANTSRLIKTSDGKKLKRKIKAAAYVECSALEREGLDDVFVQVVRVVMGLKIHVQKRECVLL